MLAGSLPFEAETREALYTKHAHEPPPPLRRVNPEVSDGVARVVARALAKAPDDRYPDAAALRRDLERLARGEPTGLPLHPVLPACDPSRVLSFDFRWELSSPPRRLWPYVTNTDRLDRALGFAPVTYAYRPDPEKGVRHMAEGVKANMTEAWEEHPYEWVEPRRMGVLREYTSGPFRWLVSTVELEPREDGGTVLTHRLRLEPSGWKSRVFSPLGVGVQFRATLGRVYRRIDATLSGRHGPADGVDPFEPPHARTPAARERLEQRLDALAGCGVDPSAVERLGELVARGAPQELARLRPLALAARWGLDPETALATCLHAAREGILVLLWDLLCPVCRVSCEVADTLRAIREHGRCEACQRDFDLDLASSVEMIFRAHPEVRQADTGLYCAGGPAHAPHVPAQVRVAAGERIELELALSDGSYRLTGPQLAWSWPFQVQRGAAARRLEVDLTRGPDAETARALAPGGQVVTLFNPGGRELLARVERESSRGDALTAARALAFAPFRDLFPGEVLAPGELVGVASVSLLVAELDGADGLFATLGDARAFERIQAALRHLDESARRAGGTVVKTLDDGVIATFPEPSAALAAALRMVGRADGDGAGPPTEPPVRSAVHRGPALVATLDGRLDYFGTAPRRARQLVRRARPGEVVFTREVAADPGVALLLRDRGLTPDVTVDGPDGPVHRVATTGGRAL
jgi:class 3 adenylate cyclase